MGTYHVRMKTPLGEKAGTLALDADGGALTGWLDIMKHREPLEGTIDEKGNCSISGTFVTLIRRVPYVATGQVSPAAVHLRVKEGRNLFIMTGSACPGSEG